MSSGIRGIRGNIRRPGRSQVPCWRRTTARRARLIPHSSSRRWLAQRSLKQRGGSVKVIVVDDHDLFRKGVRTTLSSLADCQVVGEAGSARDAFILLDSHRPDVVLMDVGLPGMDGVVATREILRRSPSARVLILSFY